MTPSPKYISSRTSKPGFYVSAVDGDRAALVSGPFETHQEALDAVQAVRDACSDPKAHWYAWGTCRVRGYEHACRCGTVVQVRWETPIGLQDDASGGWLALYNCPSCVSTYSVEVSNV